MKYCAWMCMVPIGAKRYRHVGTTKAFLLYFLSGLRNGFTEIGFRNLEELHDGLEKEILRMAPCLKQSGGVVEASKNSPELFVESAKATKQNQHRTSTRFPFIIQKLRSPNHLAVNSF